MTFVFFGKQSSALLVFVFVPAFDRHIFQSVFADGINKRAGHTGVGNQRNAVINRTSANGVPVGNFTCSVVFWDVDDQINFLFLDVFERVRVFVGFVRPVKAGRLNSVVGKELLSSTGSV